MVWLGGGLLVKHRWLVKQCLAVKCRLGKVVVGARRQKAQCMRMASEGAMDGFQGMEAPLFICNILLAFTYVSASRIRISLFFPVLPLPAIPGSVSG